MATEPDLLVIGSGSAAMVAASQASGAGRRVALVDHKPLGGTCALRGCDPKKVLMGGAATLDHARRMQDKGVAGTLHLDWDALLRFKRGFTDHVPQQREDRLREQGIEALHGTARFIDPHTVAVGDRSLRPAHILIATGAEPARLKIPGEEHLVDNEGFMALEQLPQRIVLVGGGYIAAEFSHIAARAGAQVTVLQHGKRMLKEFEPELVEWLMARSRDLDMDLRLGASVEAVERQGTGFRVRYATSDGDASVEADLVVHAAGRVPALGALDLDAGQVAQEKGRLKLNEFLQSTSNPAVYAAGDAAQVGPPLTPVAGHDGRVAVANILQGNHRKPDYRGVPSVAFTIPPIARVGLGEAQARELGLRFRVETQHTGDWYTARQAAEAAAGFKLLVEEPGGRILGAHLLGPHADELINVFALAVRHGLTADDLKQTMFAYPTSASDIGYML